MQNFERRLEEKISEVIRNDEISDIVFLCIGTSKIIGDSVGPFIGSKLKCIENEFVHVCGTIEQNLNFRNAKRMIEEISCNYKNPYIITIDAALSNKGKFGDIVLGSGYMKIGKALEKSLCFYSNINIKCVVGKEFKDKNKNMEVLKKVDVEELLKLSNIVSNGIINVLRKVSIFV